MTTRFFSTPVDHSNDAGFQAWTTELYNEIVAAGLVQTSDTGQLATPVVAARPGTNTAAGYWIFRFNDTQQGSAPIFIKIEVGTYGSVTIPCIWVTVGSGTNGAGTITGFSATRRLVAVNGNIVSTVTNYPSYICCTDGFFGISWKIGSVLSNPRHALMIGRSVASNGSPNADGFTVYYISSANSNSNQVDAYSNITNSIITSTVSTTSLIPLSLTSSTVGTTPQVFQHMTVYPRVRPNPWLLTCRSESEIPQFNQFLATVVGSVQRNYVALGVTGAGNANISNTYLAMVYE